MASLKHKSEPRKNKGRVDIGDIHEKGSLDISEPIVAGWHTHEDADPSGIFYSNDDLNWVINSQKPLYMGAKWDSTFRILPITATSIFDAVYIKDLSP